MLPSLRADERRASREVEGIVEHQLEAIDRKLRELESIRTVLRGLADGRGGDDPPECPILEEFGVGGGGLTDALLDEPAPDGHRSTAAPVAH